MDSCLLVSYVDLFGARTNLETRQQTRQQTRHMTINNCASHNHRPDHARVLSHRPIRTTATALGRERGVGLPHAPIVSVLFLHHWNAYPLSGAGSERRGRERQEDEVHRTTRMIGTTGTAVTTEMTGTETRRKTRTTTRAEARAKTMTTTRTAAMMRAGMTTTETATKRTRRRGRDRTGRR